MPRNNFINSISKFITIIFHQVLLCFPSVKPRDSKVILDKQRADGFLTSQQVTKRNFDLVEECCREGCVLEELLEYCKYF